MKIILISGATGVGTTSISAELAKEKNVIYIVGTDSIREAARQLIIPEINPYLHKSTYLAGKSKGYNNKSEDVKKEKIIRGFKIQSSVVEICINGVINRYIKEDSQSILEGINLMPGSYNSLIQSGLTHHILIDIPNEKLHLKRIKQRIEKNPSRDDAYLKNFREIRWIRDYLFRKASENNIPIINNTKTLEETIKDIISIIH